jgi:NAD(P)-dependent dehydrogenase (short-subunit alcohol dehydrogenase family)
MTASRTALVTGANQGLGRALAEGLAARLASDDRVLLTGRDPDRVAAAAAQVAATARARVEGRVLDVGDAAAVDALARELGAVDVVLSNAAARMSPDRAPADEIDEVLRVSNLGTTRVLRAFAPRLRPGGALVVVASSFGTLGHLAAPLRARFDEADALDDVDAVLLAWRDAVVAGNAQAEGWPRWINVPSKIGQVAAVRLLARGRRERDLADGTLIAAVCPGLVDTDASRPWFDDMSAARTPTEAAAPILALALQPDRDPTWYGELVRDGRVLSWTAEIAPEASAGARVSRAA